MLLLAITCAVVAQTSTSTGSEGIEVIEVTGQRTRPVGWREDLTATAEVIDLAQRWAPAESLGDVLEDAVGLQVLRTGAEGSFEGLSVRGAEPDQTRVLIGDLPVFGTDRGAVDLSFLPLLGFATVEVFRGSAPAAVDQGQIGGVVRLRPRIDVGASEQIEVGGGSFGGFFARAQASRLFQNDRVGSLGVSVGAGISGRQNDFPYLDDAGTAFVADDDRTVRRRNADFVQANGIAYSEWTAGDHRVESLLLAVDRAQGEPGPGQRPAERARRRRKQVLASAGYGYAVDGLSVEAGVNAAWDRDRFDDRFAEIGQTRERTDDRFIGVGGRLALRSRLARWLEATWLGRGRFDAYDPSNAFATPGDQPSRRWTAATTAELRAFGQLGPVMLEARPSASIRLTGARIARRSLEEQVVTSASEQVPTFRLGLFASPAPWLSLQGSVASGARLPTVLELFGNRGTLLANPALRSERSLTWDGGVLTQSRWGSAPVVVRAEVRGFISEVDNLIRYRRDALFNAIAENIAQGRTVGVEASAQVAWPPWIRLSGQATWLDATDVQGDNRQLPLRRRWTTRGMLWTRTGPLARGFDDLRASAEVVYLSSSFADPGNLIEVPDRLTVNAVLGSLHWSEHLRVTFQLLDVFDVGGVDVLGFPLPGRRFDVAVSWTEMVD